MPPRKASHAATMANTTAPWGNARASPNIHLARVIVGGLGVSTKSMYASRSARWLACGKLAFGKFYGIRLLKSLQESSLPCHRNGGCGQEGGDVRSRAFCSREPKPPFEILAERQRRQRLHLLGATVLPAFLVFQGVQHPQGHLVWWFGRGGCRHRRLTLACCGLRFHKKRTSRIIPRRRSPATIQGHRCRRSQRLHSTATMSAGGMGWASSANTGVRTRMSRGDVSYGPNDAGGITTKPESQLVRVHVFRSKMSWPDSTGAASGVNGRGRENFQTCGGGVRPRRPCTGIGHPGLQLVHAEQPFSREVKRLSPLDLGGVHRPLDLSQRGQGCHRPNQGDEPCVSPLTHGHGRCGEGV